ncbi:helix-turn-helix transcriptional regulator [Candidatus Pacearchaeota archaeon]|nr:helix-turn-helix transcriptional regulator [Candidatus Pacearchaeota archaeon]
MKCIDIKNCPIRKFFQILGSKWAFLIILELKTTKRYGEIKKAIPDVSEKMLIEKLKLLRKHGLVLRKNYNEIPPRVEYSLTESGREIIKLAPLLMKIGKNL